jgi:nucleoside-diphosphate-sugar epimerase
MDDWDRMMAGSNDGVFLTGATGFLGSALLHALVESGRPVFAMTRPQSRLDRIAGLLARPNLRLVDASPDALDTEFARRSIGTIIHAATEYGRDGVPIATILDANLILPVRLAELGIRHGARAFINIDSFFNKFHGSYSNLLNYSLSKLTLLNWLEKLSPRITIVNAVLEHMYGPGDSGSKFIEMMIRSIAIDRITAVDLTHGHQKRDFVYISDVVSAILAILVHVEDHALPFKTIGIGTGEAMQVRDMVSLIATLSDSPTELRFGTVPYRADEIMSSHADTRDLDALGWQPQVTPAAGIEAILRRYRDQAS